MFRLRLRVIKISTGRKSIKKQIGIVFKWCCRKCFNLIGLIEFNCLQNVSLNPNSEVSTLPIIREVLHFFETGIGFSFTGCGERSSCWCQALNERFNDGRDNLFQLLGLLVQDGGARQDVLQKRQKAKRRLGRRQVVGWIVGLATKVVAEIEIKTDKVHNFWNGIKTFKFLD